MSGEFFLSLMIFIIGFVFLWSRVWQLSSRLDRVAASLGRSEEKARQAADERREAVRKRIVEANEIEVVNYLCNEFGLSRDDPWIASAVKTRNRIGLDAAVTMILEKKNNGMNCRSRECRAARRAED